jgi:hypothetical protein
MSARSLASLENRPPARRSGRTSTSRRGCRLKNGCLFRYNPSEKAWRMVGRFSRVFPILAWLARSLSPTHPDHLIRCCPSRARNLGGTDLFELDASNGVLGSAEYPLSFCAESCSDLTTAASRASFVGRSITRASTTAEFVFRTKSSCITITSPLTGGSGLTGKRGRKTANACGENASAMRTETTAYFILAAKNAFTEALVSWRNRAGNFGNRTRCEFLQIKLSLDRPGLGSTLESM